jgi:hypothetical protein
VVAEPTYWAITEYVFNTLSSGRQISSFPFSGGVEGVTVCVMREGVNLILLVHGPVVRVKVLEVRVVTVESDESTLGVAVLSSEVAQVTPLNESIKEALRHILKSDNISVEPEDFTPVSFEGIELGERFARKSSCVI